MRIPLRFTLQLAKLAFTGLLCVCGAAQAQILHDNGPIFNSVGTGSGGANESVLYTTTFGMGTIGFGHQNTAFNHIADDFDVMDCAWRIDSIVFFGYQTNSPITSTFTGVYFRVWDSIPDAVGSAVVYGDSTTNRLSATRWSGVYRITETTTGNTARPIMRNVCATPGLILNSGNFWIDWTSTGSLGSGPWASARTPVGVAATGNGRQRTGSTWNPAVDGGTGAPPQGFPFIVYGASLAPSADAGADAGICPGTTTMIGGSPAGAGGRGPLSYNWSPSTGLSDSTIGQPMANPSMSMTYILTVTDSTGCATMDTVNVTVGTIPGSFLPADTTICSTSSIMLDAGPAASYLWSTGATTQTITVNTPGVYQVAAVDSQGCAAADTIIVSNPVAVSIIGDTLVCSGTTTTLSASISGSYMWSNGDSSQATSVSVGGTYSVSVTDVNGCTSSSSLVVASAASPTAAFSFFNNGLTYTFTDQSVGSPAGWSWNFGDGGTSALQSPQHTFATSGTYTVTLLVSNVCGLDTLTQVILVVGIEGSIAGSSIDIAPNPASGSFAIQVSGLESGSLEIELIDLQGKLHASYWVEDAANGAQQMVDASRLARGTYFVRLRNNGLVEMRKVVLK